MVVVCLEGRRRLCAEASATRPSLRTADRTRYPERSRERKQCPRDDLESWFYMLVEVFTGRLPWDQLDTVDFQVIAEWKKFIRKSVPSLPPSMAELAVCPSSRRCPRSSASFSTTSTASSE